MKLHQRVMLALILGGVSLAASALEQNITAEFRPAPSNPMLNKFVNTTPESGICPWHIPAQCKALEIFTIRTNELTFAASQPIPGMHSNPRQGAMWKVPSEWRDVVVTHVETGQTETVQIRIAGIGHRWDVGPNVRVWEHPDDPFLNWWARAWMYAPAPCTGVNYIASNYATFALFFWLTPENAGVCHRQPATTVDSFRYSYTEYAYAMKTPNPLKMTAGQYIGNLSYTVGPGMDFDLGDVMIPNDNMLTFNFTLDVDHHLRVEVPPGGNRVVLEPQGGWQAWMSHGRKPTRLFHDQTFNLWTSSHFKMNLECGEPMGNTCSVRNQAGHQVPLDVAVTLPFGMTDSTGGPVNRVPLRLDGVGTELFQATRYVDRKPSTLHFEVKADAVAQMLDQPGSTYNGLVTVVWDSEV